MDDTADGKSVILGEETPNIAALVESKLLAERAKEELVVAGRGFCDRAAAPRLHHAESHQLGHGKTQYLKRFAR